MTKAEYEDACVAVAPYFNNIALFLQEELKSKVMMEGADVSTFQKQFQYLSLLNTRIKNEADDRQLNK